MNDSQRDMTLSRIDEGVRHLVETKKDHEVRIRRLESAHHKQLGAMAVLSIVVSGLWQWITGSK